MPEKWYVQTHTERSRRKEKSGKKVRSERKRKKTREALSPPSLLLSPHAPVNRPMNQTGVVAAQLYHSRFSVRGVSDEYEGKGSKLARASPEVKMDARAKSDLNERHSRQLTCSSLRDLHDSDLIRSSLPDVEEKEDLMYEESEEEAL